MRGRTILQRTLQSAGGLLFFLLMALPQTAQAVSSCNDLGNNLVDTGCGDCTAYLCDCHDFSGAPPPPALCCKDTSSNNVTGCYDKATKQRINLTAPAQPTDATYINPNITEKESSPVFFTPNFTLPGSPFIAGQPIKVEGNTLGTWITFAYTFFVGVAGIVAVTMMIYGGIKYTVSFGNPSKLQDARDTISSAMIGLAIALGSYVILLTISPRLVTFQGLQDLGSISPPSEFEESQGAGQKYGISYKPVMQNVATYDGMLLAAAGGNRDFAAYIKAIMLVESSGNPAAVSHDTNGNVLACGLMQLLPSTAKVSCDELKNSPQLSIQLGTKYFQDLLSTTCPKTALYKSGNVAQCIPTCPSCPPQSTQCNNGAYHYAIAAYNGGPGANCGSVDCPGSTWWECEANPGYLETRNYVAKVEDAYAKIHGDALGQGADPAFAWSQ